MSSTRLPGVTRREVLELTALSAAAAACGGVHGSPGSPDAASAGDADAGDAAVSNADAGDAAGTDAAADAGARDGGETGEPADASDARADAAGPVTISLVHINDLHAKYNPHPRTGSLLSRARGYFEQVRSENPHSLFINGGDDYEKGSVAEVMSDGWATLEIVRAAKYDVRTLGNHDFAWSAEQLRAFTQDDHADVLCGNVFDDDGPDGAWQAKSWVVREVAGVRLGFFGLVSPPWNERNENYIGRYFPEMDARFDYAVRTREILAELQGQADVIVFVSHLGVGEDRALCAEVDGIDLVIGAHSHTVIGAFELVGGTRIVQAGSDGALAGRVDLTYDRTTRQLTDASYGLQLLGAPDVPVHAETEAAIAEIFARLAPGALDAVGTLSASLPTDELAALIAAVAVERTDVDAALCDTRILWGGLNAGAVTRQDFLNACKVERQPAGTSSWTSLHVVELTGAALAAAREAQPAWGFAGPSTLDPSVTYRLAVPKYAAYHPAEYLGGDTLSEAPLVEVWSLLTDHALERDAAGRYVDIDAAI